MIKRHPLRVLMVMTAIMGLVACCAGTAASFNAQGWELGSLPDIGAGGDRSQSLFLYIPQEKNITVKLVRLGGERSTLCALQLVTFIIQAGFVDDIGGIDVGR